MAVSSSLPRSSKHHNNFRKKYSRFLQDSVVTHINQTAGDQQGCKLDEETVLLINFADTAYKNSDGLFDITSGVLRQAWDFKSDKLPDKILKPL